MSFCSSNRHQHIVPVIDSGTYTNELEDIVFYIMPFYPHTLRDLIKDGIPGDKALALFLEILDGLQFAHRKGVWHRDIKPENILIDSQGHAVLADFGIAHFCEEELATIVKTAKNDRMANFQYAAPEQRNRGQSIDGRADVFSLGLILNEMFTGNIISGVNFPTIASVSAEYSYLDEIVQKLICQKPEDRLFPVDKIAIEILSLQKKVENEQELQKLAAQQPIDDLEEGVIATPTVIKYFYENGLLKLRLQGIPARRRDLWFSCLKDGNYSRSSILGYEPYQLQMHDADTIAMPIRFEAPNTIRQVATYIKDWLPPATEQYNRQISTINRQRRREEEDRIRKEVERLKKENAIRDMLQELNF